MHFWIEHTTDLISNASIPLEEHFIYCTNKQLLTTVATVCFVHNATSDFPTRADLHKWSVLAAMGLSVCFWVLKARATAWPPTINSCWPSNRSHLLKINDLRQLVNTLLYLYTMCARPTRQLHYRPYMKRSIFCNCELLFPRYVYKICTIDPIGVYTKVRPSWSKSSQQYCCAVLLLFSVRDVMSPVCGARTGP